MEIKTYQDVLNLQQQFVQRLQQGIGTLGVDNPLPLNAAAELARKRATLQQTQEKLAAAQSARADVLKRWDVDLARYQQTITQLQGSIATLQQGVDAAAKKAAAAQASATATPTAQASATGAAVAQAPATTTPTAQAPATGAPTAQATATAAPTTQAPAAGTPAPTNTNTAQSGASGG